MIVIPTIELRHGLSQPPGPNSADEISVPTGIPASLARLWAHAGFQRVHVIDVDAATGTGSNGALIEDIVGDGAIEVQVSGGIQSTDDIERLIDAGAVSVVVGSRGIEEPQWLASVSESFPGRVVLGTDVRERRVVTRGWVRNLPLDIFDLIDAINGLPLAGILLSAPPVNGHRTAVDLALLEDVVDACDVPVLTTGGASTMSDLRALEHRGVAAAVLAGELYTGELDLRAIAQEFGGAV